MKVVFPVAFVVEVYMGERMNKMKISQKRCDELYGAIHEEIVSVRIKLNLSAKDDVILAQVERAIWAKQKRTLGLPEYV